jgi:hypothetical protein
LSFFGSGQKAKGRDGIAAIYTSRLLFNLSTLQRASPGPSGGGEKYNLTPLLDLSIF